jgi:putative transposase
MKTSNAPKKGYKYRLYPTPEQASWLNQICGCGRKVYNTLLEDVQAEYQEYRLGLSAIKPNVSQYSLIGRIPQIVRRVDISYLARISSIVLQQKAIDLATAFTNLFKGHNAYPQWKKRGHGDSFRIVGEASIHISPYGVKIPNTSSYIEVRWSRELPSAPSSYTVTRTSSGQYYISFICEYVPNRQSGTGHVGIDLGLKDLATLSNGQTISNPHWYVQAQRQLAHLQRALSRKVRGSNNYYQAKLKLATLHQYIRNARTDYLHKLSSQLIGDNQAICLEDLQVSNMSRNRHLAKHILDAGWSMFKAMVTYKAIESSDTTLVIADRWYPSTNLCSHCGQRPTVKLKLATRAWTCEHCGTLHHRDFNASKNLEALIEPTLHQARSIGSMDRVLLTGPIAI